MESEWDNPDDLLSLLGNFWSEFIEDVNVLKDLLHNVSQQEFENFRLLHALFRMAVRRNIDVYHIEEWYPLKIREKNLIYELPTYEFSTPYTYDNNAPQIYYGITTQSLQFSYKLPDNIVDIPIISNKIHNADTIWVKGIDFYINNNKIYFVNNPFDDRWNFSWKYIYEDNVVTDREVTLWLHKSKFDYYWLTNQWGYVFGLNLPSSDNYKKLINSIIDNHVIGSNSRSLLHFLSAITDVPLVKEDQEIIEDIVYFPDRIAVVTNKNVYNYHKNSNVLFSPGDVVTKDMYLTDTVRITEFKNNIYYNDFPGITISNYLLDDDYEYELFFENKNYNLEIVNYNSVFHFKFPILGTPRDVQTFWNKLYTQAGSQSLLTKFYEYYGVTSIVNPFQFIINNILRNNTIAVRIKTHLLGTNSLPLNLLQYLRYLLPPHVLCIIITDLGGQEDIVDPNYFINDSQVSLFIPTNINETIDPTSDINEEVTISIINNL